MWNIIAFFAWMWNSAASAARALLLAPARFVASTRQLANDVSIVRSQFWAIAGPYWTSEVKWKAYGLLALVLAFTASVNGLNVGISFVGSKWSTALQGRDVATFYTMTATYFAIFCVGTPIVVLNSWFTDKLTLHWRGWLTKHILTKYMANRSYYRVDRMPGIDNPDERMASDISSFTSQALSLTMSLISAVIQFCSFILILVSISHLLTGVVVIYAFIGTLGAFLIGKKLVSIRFNQLRKEADFRYNLIHIRTNVESIALYQGEEAESKRVNERLNDALSNFNALIGWQRNLGFWTTGYGYIVALVPTLIIAPHWFHDPKFAYGTIGQADMAFGQILAALSVFVNSFDSFAAFTAVVQRLGRFNAALDEPFVPCGDTIATEIGPEFAFKNTTVETPDCSRSLVKHVDLEVTPGTGLLIKGVSGVGKSTVLKAIGGLVPNGSGSITRPDLSEILFLPQRPYMPQGTLREQLLYPHASPDTTDEQLRVILSRVNLADLDTRVGGFETKLDWPNVLSMGEQQRLVFARLLLAAPKYAILDEATSALDVENEERLYSQLASSGTTFISVAHRPTLDKYHQKVFELLGNGEYRVYVVDKD